MIKFLLNRCILILVFCFSIHSFGQQIKRLDTKEGLVYGTINVFEKDSLGFLWIGTSQGLNRYSGSGFKNYLLGSDYRFKGQEVIDIINQNGDIYLISNSGSLFKYDYKRDQFTQLLSLKDN